jgi:hypothetical protein
MTWSGHSILAAGVAPGLSACNFLEGMDLSFSRIGCAVFPETKVGAVNWDTARSVNMRIRQGEYRPMVLGFTAERPYVLRIANADDSDRMFSASSFFDSDAVGLVRVGGRNYETTCLSAVTIGPREPAEIWFVAKRDGRYELEDQLVPYLFSQGASGVIHISYARPRHISPVSHLIMPEGVPTAPFMVPDRQGNPIAPKAAPQQPPPMEIPAAPLSSAPQAPKKPPPPVAAARPAVNPSPFELPAAPLAPKKSKPTPKASEVSSKIDGSL